MKLIRLKLKKSFRSLAENFEVNFLREWDSADSLKFHPYCLAGRNGSGKSNVLEALAAIFYHIECIHLRYTPEGFAFDKKRNPNGFRPDICTPDAFELEYFYPVEAANFGEVSPMLSDGSLAHIRITKEAEHWPSVRWLNRSKFEVDKPAELSRDEIWKFLPKFILGYSSGHNEILSLPFFKMRFIHFDEYCDHLTKDVPYDGRPEGRMIYLDDQFSQAILLSHFLFPSKAILRVFETEIGLKGIRRFRIIIRRHKRFDIAKERLETMTPIEKADKAKTKVELTSKLSGSYDADNNLRLQLIDKLIKCSTSWQEVSYVTEDGEASDLYLDYLVNAATRRAFQVHFAVSVARPDPQAAKAASNAASALNLFQSLQILLTLNQYQVSKETKEELYESDSLYVNETIPMPASNERIMRFKDFEIVQDGVDDKLYNKALSDGEHQLLHTIGLCLLFRHEPVLFLLDEPETHLNPQWRASYISILRQALEADEGSRGVMREVLLTSHSPFIISDCRRENVLVFTKNPTTREVTWQLPDFETFGASANAITIKVFGQTETIGDYAMEKIKDLRQRLETGGDPDQLIKEAGKELGDSVEKVLFVNQALNRKERK